ncbi:MAG TPA: C4-type zinc ribbon domain-containing protein [Gemmataceae bacterium]|nr:C4-type zinc ribbon domain-containing protein [Gemmataceae bacterium]
MPGPAVVLREIHRLKKYAKDLQNRMEQGPRQLKAHQANISRQEDNLRLAQDGLKQLKKTILDKEGQVKSHNGQIAKHQQQLNQAASKKEYDALKVEIENDRKAVTRLEDEILDAMAAVEEKTAQLPALEKAVQQAKADLTQFERDSGARVAALTEERQRALQQLAEVEAALPADLHEQYQRQLRGRGEDAFGAVVERTCQACYTEITAQQYNDLLREAFVTCKACGRFLYLPAQ